MNKHKEGRQGDVYLVPVRRPKNFGAAVVVPRDARGRVVLAEGEVTGHAHVTTNRLAQLFSLPGTNCPEITEPVDRFFSPGPEVSTVTHEEHHAYPVDPLSDDMIYAVVIPREYTPWGDRAVQD